FRVSGRLAPDRDSPGTLPFVILGRGNQATPNYQEPWGKLATCRASCKLAPRRGCECDHGFRQSHPRSVPGTGRVVRATRAGADAGPLPGAGGRRRPDGGAARRRGTAARPAPPAEPAPPAQALRHVCRGAQIPGRAELRGGPAAELLPRNRRTPPRIA